MKFFTALIQKDILTTVDIGPLESLTTIYEILMKLSENGMKCNPLKYNWMVQETNFLGHWMTPNHIKLMKKKFNAILKMGRPKNPNEVQSFICVVNFYKYLFPRHAHLLALLTEITGNVHSCRVTKKNARFAQ